MVTDYLEASNLQADLDALGFDLVGYGCTTCIGNSGPLSEPITEAIVSGELHVGAVLSGNRNFEGRVHPHTRLNYLASPPLVVAYALAGSFTKDLLANDPRRGRQDGQPVYLRDIWPTNQEIQAVQRLRCFRPRCSASRYANVFEGPSSGRQDPDLRGDDLRLGSRLSTYVRYPPFFDGMTAELTDPLAVTSRARAPRTARRLGHHRPHLAGRRDQQSRQPGRVDYLVGHQVRADRFQLLRLAARQSRGHDARHLRQHPHPQPHGAGHRGRPDPAHAGGRGDADLRRRHEAMPEPRACRWSWSAARSTARARRRDWAAKGTRLLGRASAVIVESFERIHRSNLVGMGVLPLEFTGGVTRETLGLTGEELFDIEGVAAGLTPGMTVTCRIHRPDGSKEEIELRCRIDTADEVDYVKNGGILHYVLRNLLPAA